MYSIFLHDVLKKNCTYPVLKNNYRLIILINDVSMNDQSEINNFYLNELNTSQKDMIRKSE